MKNYRKIQIIVAIIVSLCIVGIGLYLLLRKYGYSYNSAIYLVPLILIISYGINLFTYYALRFMKKKRP